MNWALPPPHPTPCLSADPCSLRKGAPSPPLSCLTLEGAPLWTWLPLSLKKESGNISGFQIVGGGGARARLLGFKPQPCLFSPCDFGRVAEVSRALPEAVTLPKASHMVVAQRTQCGCVEPRHVPAQSLGPGGDVGHRP